MPVPCRIVAAGAHEAEISLAENVIRVAMHPADQVEAFASLSGAGATVSSIAARFGVAERTVEQRLRLGNAAPALLHAYRDDQLDLASLKAFSVTTDHGPARKPSGAPSPSRASARAPGKSSACSPTTASPPTLRSPASSASKPMKTPADRSTATSSP